MFMELICGKRINVSVTSREGSEGGIRQRGMQRKSQFVIGHIMQVRLLLTQVSSTKFQIYELSGSYKYEITMHHVPSKVGVFLQRTEH
jgi:hypothetical protein